MKQSHRYTNLEHLRSKVKERMKMEDSHFELVSSEFDNEEQIEEDNVQFLHEEDETTHCLHMCMIKSMEQLIPKKEEFELTDSLGEDLMNEKNGKTVIMCTKHNGKTANFVCINKSCEYVFYCMSCRKQHAKDCNRKEMFMNIKDLYDKNMVDQYFDTNDFDYEGQIDQVKEMIKNSKERMNEIYDILEKNLICKIKFHSKEFIFNKVKAKIEDKFDEFEGKKVKNF